MKIVPVKHRNGGATYVFSTTENLHKGDIVLCQTKKGDDIGTCVSDSFEAEGTALEFILKECGTTLERMRPVLGVFVYHVFDNKSEKPTSSIICGIPADTPIDTPVLVWDAQYPNYKRKKHFAGIDENGKVLSWAMGETSWTAVGDVEIWDCAELVK